MTEVMILKSLFQNVKKFMFHPSVFFHFIWGLVAEAAVCAEMPGLSFPHTSYRHAEAKPHTFPILYQDCSLEGSVVLAISQWP